MNFWIKAEKRFGISSYVDLTLANNDAFARLRSKFNI